MSRTVLQRRARSRRNGNSDLKSASAIKAGSNISLRALAHGDTASHIEARCDLLRNFRVRESDCAHLVVAPLSEIRPARLMQQLLPLHRQTKLEDKTLLKLPECHRRERR